MDLLLRIQIGNLATLRRRRSLRLAGEEWNDFYEQFIGIKKPSRQDFF